MGLAPSYAPFAGPTALSILIAIAIAIGPEPDHFDISAGFSQRILLAVPLYGIEPALVHLGHPVCYLHPAVHRADEDRPAGLHCNACAATMVAGAHLAPPCGPRSGHCDFPSRGNDVADLAIYKLYHVGAARGAGIHGQVKGEAAPCCALERVCAEERGLMLPL